MNRKISAALITGMVAGGALAGSHTILAESDRTPDVTLVPEKDLTKVPENGLGSISIELTESKDNRPRDNVKFGLYKVADVINGEYVLNDDFAQSEVDLNDIKTANDMEEVARKLSRFADESLVTELVTDYQGKTRADQLSVGVYLLQAEDIAGYEFIAPFLIAIPTWDDVDELFLYDVDVLHKHDQLPKIAVDKVDAATGVAITSNDFQFTSYSDPECKEKLDVVAGNITDGTATFEVDYGITYIKETGAPMGYMLSDEVVKVEINDEGMYVNDSKVDPGDDLIYHYVYNNTLLGGAKTAVGTNAGLLMAIGGASIVIVGIIAIKMKRKQN